MIKTTAIEKTNQGYYKTVEGSDQELSTLFTLLILGSSPDIYIKFLLDNSMLEFQDEETDLTKKGNMVSIEINDYLFPGHPLFTTTQPNLLSVLKQWKQIIEIKPDKIELVLLDGKLSIKSE